MCRVTQQPGKVDVDDLHEGKFEFIEDFSNKIGTILLKVESQNECNSSCSVLKRKLHQLSA